MRCRHGDCFIPVSRFTERGGTSVSEAEHNGQVVIVDDDDLVRRSIRLVVRRLTNDIVECATGRTALQQARNEPSAVILDLGLPDADGLDLLLAIKEAVPAVPVIVVTASNSIDTALEAVRRGAEDFVTKPFVTERLLSAVRNAIRVSSLARRVAELERETDPSTSDPGFGNLITAYDSSVDGDGPLIPLLDVERRHVALALQRCRGNLSEAARALGIGRTTLYRKIEKYGLQFKTRS